MIYKSMYFSLKYIYIIAYSVIMQPCNMIEYKFCWRS